jgi:hypothetical protein
MALAAAYVRSYTLFENPMLSAQEVVQLLTESWTYAQNQTGFKLDRVKVTDAHVSIISHSWRQDYH